MKELASTKTDYNTENEFLIASIRTAVLRAKLNANELMTVGIALKNKIITAQDAVAWLADLGLIECVIPDKATEAA
jgi:hypothetical protein